MLNSMTAFGNARAPWSGGELNVEIRSVNHRYLDITIKAPEGVRAIEQDIRETISKRFKRGKVECAIRIDRGQSGGHDFTVNTDAVDALGRALQQVAGILGQDGNYTPDPARVLSWPGVLTAPTEDPDTLQALALESVNTALKAASAHRAREGAAISAHLSTRNAEIATLIDQLGARRPAVLAHQRARLEARLSEFDTEVDPSRLEQELVIAAQKLDIDEELERLKAHVAELTQALDKREPVGRRLDFLMQEFNREANTVSSKSNDRDTTALAVDLKVCIEQMREQVQNVE